MQMKREAEGVLVDVVQDARILMALMSETAMS
jgi:hypothetical protein